MSNRGQWLGWFIITAAMSAFWFMVGWFAAIAVGGQYGGAW